ncbi:hypothetical protein PthBH41_37780 (plasmid) [Parageobacillus thermoglucosidasius]|nr:hypothetical protein PthBH41_37780 [Parageobacillus thermoglucosidasius]
MVPLFAYWQQNIAGHSPVRAGDAGFGPSISVPGFYVFTMKKIGIRSAPSHAAEWVISFNSLRNRAKKRTS